MNQSIKLYGNSTFLPPIRSRTRYLSSADIPGKKRFPVLEKDVLAVGLAVGDYCPKWNITTDDLKKLAQATNRFIQSGHRCAWVNGHFGERTRLGDVYQFEVRGDRLYAKFKLLDNVQIESGRYGRNPGDETWDEVSVETDKVDFLNNGNAEQVILAVATVTTPVITGQGPFVRKLSKSSPKPKPRQIVLSKRSMAMPKEEGDGLSASGASYTTKPNASYVEIADLKQWMPDIPSKVTTFAQLEIYMEVKMGQSPDATGSDMPSADDIANAPVEDLTGEGMMSSVKPAIDRSSAETIKRLESQIKQLNDEKQEAFMLSLTKLVRDNNLTPGQSEVIKLAGKQNGWSLSSLEPFVNAPSQTVVKTERRVLSTFGDGTKPAMTENERRAKFGLPPKKTG